MVTTLKYLFTFRNWISTNTSGIVIIDVRDKFKEFAIENSKRPSHLEALLTPFGSLYNNLTTIQIYDHDQLLQYAGLWFDGKIDVVSFQLKNEAESRISLSWHLTKKEKKQIKNAVLLKENQEAFERLKELLK
jgi:hypothetical protein